MKFIITLLATLLPLAASASNRVADMDLFIDCHLASEVLGANGVLQAHEKSAIALTLPRMETVTLNSMTGPYDLRFGTGHVEANQSLRFLDRNKDVIQSPVKIVADISMPSPQTKRLRMQLEFFNPFTGQIESSPLTDNTIPVANSFIYVHQEHNHPNPGLAVPGDLVQNFIFCTFLKNLNEE